MFIRPTAGRQVPDPERGGFVPEKGRSVPKTQYWLRRIKDNDVTKSATPKRGKK